jgi:hypothetical protein
MAVHCGIVGNNKDKYNGQKKIDNRTNNDIQNTSTYKVELRWKKNYWKLKE